jgi:hypothetical protein
MEHAEHKRLRGLCRANAAAEQEKEDDAGDEGAEGVEERIHGGGGAAHDERLVNLVEGRVACGDGKSGKSPSPAPAGAGAAHAAEQKQIENELFGKVSGFADEKVDDGELVLGKRGKKPAKNGQDNRGSVVRGKGVGGKSEDATSPDDCRPPGAQPGGDERHALAKFVEFRGGARIAPGLFRQEELQKNFANLLNCDPLQSLVFVGIKRAALQRRATPCDSSGLRA